MKKHVASVHEGKKPFKCDLCGYRGSDKGNLKRHVSSVHEGNKPFKCEICDYSCSLKDNMEKDGHKIGKMGRRLCYMVS